MKITARMQLGENTQMALTTLRENKMRSFLTVLGVVIGITALLSVVSILMGVYADVNAYLSDYGPDTLFVFRFDPGIHTGRLTPEERARKPLTLEDAEAIRELCPAVRAVIFKCAKPLAARLQWAATRQLSWRGTRRRKSPRPRKSLRRRVRQ